MSVDNIGDGALAFSALILGLLSLPTVLSSSGLSREQIGESKREIARQVSAAQTAAEVEAAEFSNPGRSTQVIRSLTISPATFTNASAVATIMAAEVAPRLTCLRRRAREIANPLCAERVR
eukprot:scaffold296291_cov31-Tisochrysis_lutea.AAC.1